LAVAFREILKLAAAGSDAKQSDVAVVPTRSRPTMLVTQLEEPSARDVVSHNESPRHLGSTSQNVEDQKCSDVSGAVLTL
jgi:hypothetical protein